MGHNSQSPNLPPAGTLQILYIPLSPLREKQGPFLLKSSARGKKDLAKALGFFPRAPDLTIPSLFFAPLARFCFFGLFGAPIQRFSPSLSYLHLPLVLVSRSVWAVIHRMRPNRLFPLGSFGSMCVCVRHGSCYHPGRSCVFLCASLFHYWVALCVCVCVFMCLVLVKCLRCDLLRRLISSLFVSIESFRWKWPIRTIIIRARSTDYTRSMQTRVLCGENA